LYFAKRFTKYKIRATVNHECSHREEKMKEIIQFYSSTVVLKILREESERKFKKNDLVTKLISFFTEMLGDVIDDPKNISDYLSKTSVHYPIIGEHINSENNGYVKKGERDEYMINKERLIDVDRLITERIKLSKTFFELMSRTGGVK
jgi:hypothetical protein